jgi:hypothetical protein
LMSRRTSAGCGGVGTDSQRSAPHGCRVRRARADRPRTACEPGGRAGAGRCRTTARLHHVVVYEFGSLGRAALHIPEAQAARAIDARRDCRSITGTPAAGDAASRRGLLGAVAADAPPRHTASREATRVGYGRWSHVRGPRRASEDRG